MHTVHIQFVYGEGGYVLVTYTYCSYDVHNQWAATSATTTNMTKGLNYSSVCPATVTSLVQRSWMYFMICMWLCDVCIFVFHRHVYIDVMQDNAVCVSLVMTCTIFFISSMLFMSYTRCIVVFNLFSILFLLIMLHRISFKSYLFC